ncbi:gag-proteinase polyprotein [Cucumis melo var. makuwa]|uniref:Gag-proteinase polyprotein n=1 Tax=Cucumis melo var. makuwa TaxID=1194695 RepID=A0A5A7VAS5_CUCMM|nr:gag-proteinase polyprotein [Cucumis melo var. makuwa]
MEIIREGPSTSRPPVLKAPKPEVNWTDAEEQTSVGNARALDAIFNEIPDSKIVQKVLQSLPRKFDMKVTAIEEAHDITTLKLDELFGSLLTFEMAISDRENKKGKGIAFKSIYEEETIVNQSDNEVNMDESITLLTKQFSKVVKKFKNMNTIGSNAQNSNQYRRKDGENTTKRYNEVSIRRGGDYGKKNEGEGRFFRCTECGGVGHYQAECPMFLRRQKKNFRAILSDKDTDDSEDDTGMNAFTACIT